jgi:signal transduction histidine kinase
MRKPQTMSLANFWRTRLGITSALLGCLFAVISPFAILADRFANLSEALAYGGLAALACALVAFAGVAALKNASMSPVENRSADQQTQTLLFNTAVNKMSQGLCFFDGQQRLIMCNDRYAEMYKLSRDMVRPGTTLREIVDHRFSAGCFPRMDPAEYLKWRDSIAVSQVASDSVVELQDGRVIAIHHEPMPDAGWVATHEDITTLERTKGELRTLNATLEQRVIDRTAALENSNRELETFAYSVAHDFRAPLRAMDGYSAVLLEEHRNRLDDEARDYLTRIRASSVRLGKLTDDLLNLAQVAKQEIRRETVDLSAVAAAVIARLRAEHPDRLVETAVEPGLKVEGDATLLEFLMRELLGNAWKFTAMRPDARIEVGSTRAGEELACFVRDNGVGFDLAYAPKLFAPFSRLHHMDAFPGTGIGLAIAKTVVSRHRGRIWVSAEAGAGATFFFSLAS